MEFGEEEENEGPGEEMSLAARLGKKPRVMKREKGEWTPVVRR